MSRRSLVVPLHHKVVPAGVEHGDWGEGISLKIWNPQPDRKDSRDTIKASVHIEFAWFLPWQIPAKFANTEIRILKSGDYSRKWQVGAVPMQWSIVSALTNLVLHRCAKHEDLLKTVTGHSKGLRVDFKIFHLYPRSHLWHDRIQGGWYCKTKHRKSAQDGPCKISWWNCDCLRLYDRWASGCVYRAISHARKQTGYCEVIRVGITYGWYCHRIRAITSYVYFWMLWNLTRQKATCDTVISYLKSQAEDCSCCKPLKVNFMSPTQLSTKSSKLPGTPGQVQ